MAHMGQGPYGPGPIWARAHMGSGPIWTPGPSLLGKHIFRKRTLKIIKLCYLYDVKNRERCATSVRSFWRRYRAEISAMCQKTKVSILRKNK